MTTVKSLNEDLLYTILSKCASSIDMWHFLQALDYEIPRMIHLRAFWSRIRLSSLHTKSILLSFIKEIALYCVDLRIDNLNWMIVGDLRRVLSNFRSLVSFHTGNVSLSKSILLNDVKMFFPFLKYVTLLIPLDSSVISSSSTRQLSINNDLFQEICTSLNEMNELEHISLMLQDTKGACLSESGARFYFRLACEYLSKLKNNYKLISIEENSYEIRHRFFSADSTITESSFGQINLSLISKLNHLIVSFRPMSNLNLTLNIQDSSIKKLKLHTLVLPCVPSTSDSIDILDLYQLQILDISYINVKNRIELMRLDEILFSYRQNILRNLTINLSEWQLARFLVVWKKQDNSKQTTVSTSQFSSVFENCFDEITTLTDNDFDDEDMITTIAVHSPINIKEKLPTIIDEFSLEFIDESQSSTFQLSLKTSWLNKLTNLNLTGIHCHSIDFKHMFNSLYLLQSLSLSPCILLYIDQCECHCQMKSTSVPYEIHSLSKTLHSLNLTSNISNMKQPCSSFVDQYKLHCIRHSSIHQYLSNDEVSFQYENLIRYCIQKLIQTLDLHHLSIRIPNYEFHIDDLHLPNINHIESLIFDVKIPMTFHAKLTSLYSNNILHGLRRFILISDNNFQLTPLLIDKFRLLELVEIISLKYHLNRSTINYLQRVLKPTNYPNLNTLRFWIGSVDAKHALKHLHKTIRLAFENIKPAFQFDISIINQPSKLNGPSKCILYDSTHEIHQYFHSLQSIHSSQLSISYPNFLNYKPSYSEQKFDR